MYETFFVLELFRSTCLYCILRKNHALRFQPGPQFQLRPTGLSVRLACIECALDLSNLPWHACLQTGCMRPSFGHQFLGLKVLTHVSIRTCINGIMRLSSSRRTCAAFVVGAKATAVSAKGHGPHANSNFISARHDRPPASIATTGLPPWNNAGCSMT